MWKNLRNVWVGGAVAIALIGSIAPLSATSVAAAEAGPQPASVTPTSGSTSTSFQLNLGSNPSCPGDSASGGYRWQTFLVPQGTDPSLLTFESNGPVSADGGFASPLFASNGDPVVNRLTSQAVGSDPSGGIFGLPQFSFGVFGPGELPAGQYTAGVACTKGPLGPEQVSNTWSFGLNIFATESGLAWSTDAAAVDNGAATLSVESGDSDTPFQLGLGTNPSCPGDSATGGYRWQTFMVPASSDLSTLTFTTSGPVAVSDETRIPLFSVAGDPVANRLTDQAAGASPVGGITGIPVFDFSVLAPGDIPAGVYNVGIACTVGPPSETQLRSFWSTPIRVVALSSGGGPAQLEWSTGDAPVDNGAMTLSTESGTSATSFQLGLGTNPSCPGDSATGGYRWQTFMVPASSDLSTLTFTTSGPVAAIDEFRAPLFSVAGDPVANRLTDQATGGSEAGGITGIPALNFSVFAPGDIPAGAYQIGVACTLGTPSVTQIRSYWSTPIVVAANGSGSDPARITWVGVPRTPLGLSADLTEGAITLSWDVGSNDGGAGTTGYIATSTSGVRACSTSQTTCTISPLPTDGVYSFSVQAVSAAGSSAPSAVTGLLTPGAGSADPEFVDVPAGSFFVRATSMLKLRGITEGTNPAGDQFSPDRPVNRQQMAAFLWRLAGEPAGPASCGFTDEAAIPEFAKVPACWLKAEEITVNNPYNPAGIVNRQQMALFMWRFAGEPDAPTSCGYSDDADIGAVAKVATCWLKQTDITTNNPYRPLNPVNRAQMSAFLYRLGAQQGLWVRIDD